MADDVFGELFLDEEGPASDIVPGMIIPPVTVPAPPVVEPAPGQVLTAPVASEASSEPAYVVEPEPEPEAPAMSQPDATQPEAASVLDELVVAQAPVEESAAPVPVSTTAVERTERERRLAAALDGLMEESQDIEAAALVSLDGFIMASALPEGMQEDRVGAMSAAILGLGERAAAELGRGKLSQVFIEGEDGYVLLMAAGERAVLTCLAARRAKLGLVIFDMKGAAQAIGQILG